MRGGKPLRSRQPARIGPHSASDGLLAGMTERELSEHVRVTLAALPGVEAYHTYDSRRSEPGFPDFVVLVGDRAWAIELKTATGRVTPAQTRWLAAFARLPRWRALVVRPQDWPAVRDEIVEAAIGGEQ